MAPRVQCQGQEAAEPRATSAFHCHRSRTSFLEGRGNVGWTHATVKPRGRASAASARGSLDGSQLSEQASGRRNIEQHELNESICRTFS